jgi:hypothetical protein
VPILEKQNRYIIFYPELIEDWGQYKNLLEERQGIKIDNPAKPENIITVTLKPSKTAGKLYLYESSRAELRSVINEILRLHNEEQVYYEDIALNVPELKKIESYITREFSLYDIPVHAHSGAMLGEYGTGRFWRAVSECVQNKWTFMSVKSLLLNNQIPWKKMETNRALINFGIENNCVCGYFDDNKYVDVWETALFVSQKKEMHSYYVKLVKTLTKMCRAKTFDELRIHFFDFRINFFSDNAPVTDETIMDVSKNQESDAVLSRCIDELWNLIALEKDFPFLTPEDPYGFFISVLDKKQYVPRREEKGVHLFDYKMAAASPFKYHFVINANQESASIVYKPLKFLNDEKRKVLGVEDNSASIDYFNAYKNVCSGNFYISAASHSFTGWKIPHSFYSGHIEQAVLKSDMRTEEVLWWDCGGVFPSTLSSGQVRGFKKWYSIQQIMPAQNKIPLAANYIPYYSRISTSDSEEVYIKSSATDLTVFFDCPRKWLYSRVLGIEEFQDEARLLDDNSKGLIYHAVLSLLFNKIKLIDKCFKKENISLYNDWLEQITKDYFINKLDIPNVLLKPFLSALTLSVIKTLKKYLNTEAVNFNNYAVEGTECLFSMQVGGLILKGFIDRVSINLEGEPVIIDYKTKNTPSFKSCVADSNNQLENFQIACYVKLYEALNNKKTEQAVFSSLVDHKIVSVIDADQNKNNRAEFEKTITALDTYIQTYKEKVSTMCISSKDVPFYKCLSCIYKHICRKTYMLNYSKIMSEKKDYNNNYDT